MREGRLSLDQVGVIAARAGQGSDEHYAQLAQVATVTQLRTAVKLEPRPVPDAEPDPELEPQPESSFSASPTESGCCYRITLSHLDAAKFDAAVAAHRDALINHWKLDNDTSNTTDVSGQRPPMPSTVDAFMRLVEAGWDTEAARRPHGQHTTVVVHVDVEQKAAALHLGPLLSDAERRYLTCDATCEVWFHRDGEPIGAGPNNPADQPAAAPRARAPPPHVRGPWLRRHPGSARPPPAALGRRRPHRAGQPGTAVPLSPPAAPPRPDHHHRTRTRSHRHRRHRPTTKPGITSAPTHKTPTRRPTLPRTHRRTRPMVVVSTLPTPTTTDKPLAV